jgi:hypothetical protein
LYYWNSKDYLLFELKMQLTSTLFLAFLASSHASTIPQETRQLESGQEYQRCGGFVVDPKTCPKGYQCVQPDPRRPEVTDLPGICLPNKPLYCGGVAGIECVSTNFTAECYDWPNDDCNPKNGGTDCIGVCLDRLPA